MTSIIYDFPSIAKAARLETERKPMIEPVNSAPRMLWCINCNVDKIHNEAAVNGYWCCLYCRHIRPAP